MSEVGGGLSPIFEQIGAPVVAEGVETSYGNIVDLRDPNYQLTKPLRTALAKHPDTIIAEEPYTQYYGFGDTNDAALISLREIMITFREEIGNTPDENLSSHLQGHKKFLNENLVLKSIAQTE